MKKGGILRITSGLYRGRTIKTPGGATHPMGERERLALFNALGLDFFGIAVLDAFAGSGALGIEALSRGAGSICFVEKNRMAASVIRENLESLNVSEEKYQILVSDVAEVDQGIFDLILADPPYDIFRLEDFKNLPPLLSEDGILVLSHPDEVPEIAGLTAYKAASYAGANLSFYRKNN